MVRKNNIKEAVIAITYKCNSKCRMCNIWQIKNHDHEFKISDLKSLPKSIKDLNLTGGEPFLRKDIVEIIKFLNIHLPKANIVISSNGFSTDLILKKATEIFKISSKIGIALSVDGMEKKHDYVRRVAGGFLKIERTLLGLKSIGFKNLKLAFTLADYNYEELAKVYKYAEEKRVELSLALVHSAENFFAKENSITKLNEINKSLDWLISHELKYWSKKRLGRAYFAYGLKYFLNTGKRILPDYSGSLNIFVNPIGEIFPCDVSSKKIGSLKLFNKIKYNNTPDECQKSWMICTARQAIKKHFLKVAWWILRNKFKN